MTLRERYRRPTEGRKREEMTSAQALRVQREKRHEMEREKQLKMLVTIIGLVVAILFMGIAGEMDYQDRTQILGASMLPAISAE